MILINASPGNTLRAFQPFLPVYVPVGIAAILAVAEREGVQARVIDMQVERDAVARADEAVRAFDHPPVFGFSVLTAALRSAVELARVLKARYPDAFICFGGVHPSAAPDEVLAFREVDAVLRGEADHSFLELYRCVREGRDHRSLAGLSYRGDRGIVHNPGSAPVKDLDSLPLFPYHRFTSPRYDLGFVISSRGCPYGCIFCSNRITTGRQYRTRSAEAVLEELRVLSRTYGKREVLFLDDNFLVDRERVLRLAERIRREGLERRMTFSFQARADNTDREVLRELSAAGFRSVFFGIETASERLMKVINKGETVAQCIDAVTTAKQEGFHVSATFIYALPGESREDRWACARLSRELGIDMVRFNNATPYPGTRLHEIARQEGRLRVDGLYENFVSVSTFVENPFRSIPFSYVPENSTEDQIRRDILLSYFLHYLRLRRLAGVFTRSDRGVGWFNAGKRVAEVLRNAPALALLAGIMFLKFGQLLYFLFVKADTRLPLRQVLALWRTGEAGGRSE